MSDHELSTDCDRDGPCQHWVYRTDPLAWQRITQNAAELRRLGAAAARPVSWYLMQLAFHEDPAYAIDRHPILLNEGTPYQEPFGITRALEWAERLAALEEQP